MTGLDFFKQSTYGYTIESKPSEYTEFTFTAGGPQFQKFLKWLDSIEVKEDAKEEKYEGFNW